MRYIFSALIALSLIAVTAHDRLDNRAEATAIEPAPTDPSGQAQEGWAEKLFPEGLSHDFGTVPRGTQSFYKFKMKNIFSEPLELTLRISCGCVTAKPSVQILEPLQEGTIDVLMDAKKYQGPKTVTVEVTVGPKYVSTARLTVTGNCRMDVVLNPGQFNFGNILPGQRPGSQSLDVEYAGNADWRITGLDKQTASVDISYEQLYRRPGGVGYRVSATLKEKDLQPGPFKYELYLKTNDPSGTLVPILIEGTVRAALTASPNPLSFGKFKVGESAEKLILLRGAGVPFRVLSVDGLGDEIAASLPTKALLTPIVRVTYRPQKPGPLHKDIVIKTDLDKEPQIKVTVDGSAEQ